MIWKSPVNLSHLLHINNIMRTIIYIIVTILAALLTFFGIGPVLFADGSMNERLITLAIVLVGYAVLAAIVLWVKKKNIR